MGPEAKMKPKRGNGTPHPKGGRRSLVRTPHEEHLANQNENTRSSLKILLHVHTQVSQTLHQIDTMVLRMHKLASTNHVDDAEVRSFADALANFDENLQDWNIFLKAAAERSSYTVNLDQEQPTTETLESTPDKRTSLSPLITDLDRCAISYSPLVPSSDCESPCDSEEALMRTPPLGKTTLSPLSETPHILSPPRSIRVLSNIREISPLSLYSSCETPGPEDSWTPERPTCQSQLVFETPSPYPNDEETILLQTPGFGVSPPRTCNPLRHGDQHVAAENVHVPATPVMPSPFRTPGILFECSSVPSESSSPLIVDDLTTSTVKRLGQKGLEERLWQELAIRKADVLRSSVQFR